MARMRTIDREYAEIHAADPDSAVSKKLIWHLVIIGEIPSCMAGKKYLLNFDALERYLTGEEPSAQEDMANGKLSTVEEAQEYISEKGLSVNAEYWFDYYASKGWMVGKTKMKDWKAAVRTWEHRGKNKTEDNGWG